MAPSTVFIGGNSAGYFARELAGLGATDILSGLTIVTDEPHLSYERPALSKAYLAPAKPARLPGFTATVGGGGERQEAGWYEERGVTYRVNSKVTAVDAAAKTVALADGTTLPYDTLVVATGARPLDLAADFNVPGADAKGIHYLRNVADADALYAAIQAAAGSGEPVVVVGGGYVGVEVTGMLTLWGIKPTVVFPEDRILARQLSPPASSFYQTFFTAKGAAFKSGVSAVSFAVDADGAVSSVTLSDGSALPARLVVVGAGARPNVGLLAAAGVAVLDAAPGGVKTDASLRTSDPAILAVGDVAAFPGGEGGAPVRHEHVAHARASAAHAARVVAGKDGGAPYTYLPYFYSRADAYGLAWVFYGDAAADAVEWGARDGAAAAAGGGPKAVFGTYYVQDGRVVGAFLEGGSPDDNAAVAAVARGRPPVPAGGAGELERAGLDFARGVAKM